MSMTEHDLQNMQNRLARARNPKASEAADQAKREKWIKGEEKSLQDAIQKDCERRGYFVLRSRMDKKTVYRKGFPDLVIFGPNGKCVLIECKAGDNTPSEDQLHCGLDLICAGAKLLVAYNLAEAIEFVKYHLQPAPSAAAPEQPIL